MEIEHLPNYVKQYLRDEFHADNCPVRCMLNELQRREIQAVVFGGTLRTLLLNFSSNRSSPRRKPRDIDIVISHDSIDVLLEIIGETACYRRNRFGGIHAKIANYKFDFWTLESTRAFQEDNDIERTFSRLPATTFFNIEAIAMDLWNGDGQEVRTYDGDGQFLKGMQDRLIEINRESNPFPALCIVRAFVFARKLKFAFGKKLAKYIVDHGTKLDCKELSHATISHYGKEVIDAKKIKEAIHKLECDLSKNYQERISSPLFKY